MLPSMQGNIPCAVDVETTGRLEGYHEIIQIACVPLNQHFEPHESMRFFYLNIAPDHPDRMSKEAERKHKLTPEFLSDCVSQEKGIALFEEWHQNLNLPFRKRLVPLAHNWAFEKGFLTHWLGLDYLDEVWYIHPRDSFTAAAFINDLFCWHGRNPPFNKLALTALTKRFDVQLDNAHDALADCLATAKLYAEFLRFLHG